MRIFPRYGFVGIVGIAAAVCLLAAVPFIADAGQQVGKPPVSELGPVKSDIIVSSVSFDKIQVARNGDHSFRINVVIANRILNSSTGAFKVLIEWTEDPAAGFNRLGEAGVTNLANSAVSRRLATATLYFSHTVPRGKAYKYRITADHTNMVDERDETNNIYNAGYNNN